MTAREIQDLDGKLRRTAYAIVWDHLLKLTDTLDKKQVKKLAENVYGAMTQAVEDAVEYLIEYEIIKRARKSRKKAKKNPAESEIFIRKSTKKEQIGGANMRRGFQSIPDIEGYEKVHKPYGKDGAGYYYVRQGS